MSREDIGFAIVIFVAVVVGLYILGGFVGRLLRKRSEDYPLVSYYVIKDSDENPEIARIGPYQDKQRALDANYFYLQGKGIVARLVHYPSGISELIRVWPTEPKPEIGNTSTGTDGN